MRYPTLEIRRIGDTRSYVVSAWLTLSEGEEKQKVIDGVTVESEEELTAYTHPIMREHNISPDSVIHDDRLFVER